MNIGTPIQIIKGRDTGETGRVFRICEITGWLFVTLDKYADDRSYRHMIFWPLIESEMKTIGG